MHTLLIFCIVLVAVSGAYLDVLLVTLFLSSSMYWGYLFLNDADDLCSFYLHAYNYALGEGLLRRPSYIKLVGRGTSAN